MPSVGTGREFLSQHHRCRSGGKATLSRPVSISNPFHCKFCKKYEPFDYILKALQVDTHQIVQRKECSIKVNRNRPNRANLKQTVCKKNSFHSGDRQPNHPCGQLTTTAYSREYFSVNHCISLTHTHQTGTGQEQIDRENVRNK